MKKILCFFISIAMLINICSYSIFAYADDTKKIELNKTYIYETNSSATEKMKFTLTRSGFVDFNITYNYVVEPEPSKNTDLSNVVIGSGYYAVSLIVKTVFGDTVYSYSYDSNPIYQMVGGETKIVTPAYLLSGTYYVELNYRYVNISFTTQYVDSNENYVESYYVNNNTKEDAETLNFNKNIIGTLGIDDSLDYYKFVLDKASTVVINVQTQCGNVRHTIPNGVIAAPTYTYAEMAVDLLYSYGLTVGEKNKNETKTPDTENYTKFAQVSNQNRTFTYELEKGTYYIKFSSWDVALKPNYVFSVTKKCKEHNYQQKSKITPTCTKSGTLVNECVDCGYIKTTSLNATGHQYSAKVVKPTSTALGYTLHSCSGCGVSYQDTFKAPTGKQTLKCKARTAAAQTVTWNNVKSANGYQVQISTKDGKKWSTYATLKAGVTNYTFKKLAAGNNYKFRVRFYIKAADGKNYFSPWSTTLNSPTLPVGTTVSKLGAGSKAFTVQWKQNKAVNGYQLQYSLKSNFSGAKTLTIKSNKTLKTTVKKFSAKKVYYVRVRTYKTITKANYFSAWSKAYKVKTK